MDAYVMLKKPEMKEGLSFDLQNLPYRIVDGEVTIGMMACV